MPWKWLFATVNAFTLFCLSVASRQFHKDTCRQNVEEKRLSWFYSSAVTSWERMSRIRVCRELHLSMNGGQRKDQNRESVPLQEANTVNRLESRPLNDRWLSIFSVTSQGDNTNLGIELVIDTVVRCVWTSPAALHPLKKYRQLRNLGERSLCQFAWYLIQPIQPEDHSQVPVLKHPWSETSSTYNVHGH